MTGLNASSQARDEAIIDRALGDLTDFFGDYWRRRPLLSRDAAQVMAGCYGVDDFLTDLVATHPSPYLAVSVHDGARRFSQHGDATSLRHAVGEGAVVAMKISRLWHEPAGGRFAAMRHLFGTLCRRVAMLYLSPSRSEDVDLFLAGPDSALGAHFDTTDVFTVQLCGERRWLVDRECDVEKVRARVRDRGWYPAQEIPFSGETEEFVLRPGDALYVPAYAVHQVTGVSWSVSLSLGLRAFNEVDLLEHMLDGLRRSAYLDYGPLAARAASQGEAAVQARLDGMRRLRDLMRQLEGLAFAAFLAPLDLPADLQGDESSVIGAVPAPASGAYRSAFALWPTAQ
jgi:ribosomal protein L16 Arg81 hydroxylase